MTDTGMKRFWSAARAGTDRAALPAALYAPGASSAALQALDDALFTGCPESLAALLRCHDGAGAGWYCFSAGNFLSCSQILAERAERGRDAAALLGAEAGLPDCVGPVRPAWWSDLWIPFLKRNKELVCLDLSPAAGGSVGQVIEVDWEGRVNRVLSPSLDGFLERVLAELSSG